MSILENTLDLPPVIDPEKDYLSELVGEGKKYKTERDLARAAVEKETHIQRVERENAELRESLKANTTTKKLEDVLDQLSNLRAESPSNVDNQPREPDITNPGLTPSDVKKMLSAHDENRRKKMNSDNVRNRLREVFGNDYVTKVKEQADSLGVGPEFLDSIAQTNPTAFYKLMGVEENRRQPSGFEDVSFAPPRSQVTPGFKPTSNEKNWSYYEHMRKTEPNRYHSIKVQNEMMDEAMKAASEGRDFGIRLS